MDKLSSDQVDRVLRVVPETLRSLAGERDYWRKTAEAYMRRGSAEKVAHAMHAKGVNVDVDLGSLIEQLEKKAEEGQLDRIAEAVDLIAPQDMGRKIASVGEDTTGTSSSTDFERYIMGSVG